MWVNLVGGLCQKKNREPHGRAVVASQSLAHVFGKPQTFAKRAGSAQCNANLFRSRESLNQAFCFVIIFILPVLTYVS